MELAYVEYSDLPGATWRAELANPGGKVLPLTKIIASSGQNDSTQLSADGQKIVFRSCRSGSCDIWKSDADGSNQRQLTFLPRAGPVLLAGRQTGNGSFSTTAATRKSSLSGFPHERPLIPTFLLSDKLRPSTRSCNDAVGSFFFLVIKVSGLSQFVDGPQLKSKVDMSKIAQRLFIPGHGRSHAQTRTNRDSMT